MSLHEIGGLIKTDPDLAKKRILDALSESEGNRENAASILRAGPKSLYRWIEKLDLWPDVDAIRKRLPAPPRSRSKIMDALRESSGDLSQAALALRITEETLVRRMKELGIAWPETPQETPPPAA